MSTSTAPAPTIILSRAQRDNLCQRIWTDLADYGLDQMYDDHDTDAYRAHVGLVALWRALDWTPNDESTAIGYELALTAEIVGFHESVLRRTKRQWTGDEEEGWIHREPYRTFVATVDMIDAALVTA